MILCDLQQTGVIVLNTNFDCLRCTRYGGDSKCNITNILLQVYCWV